MLDSSNSSVSAVVENTQEITEEVVNDEIKEDERRKFPRRAARWAATITTRDKTVVQCKTRDVSERGASIVIPYDFNMNAIVILEMQVIYKDIRKKIRVLGQVRHRSVASDGFNIGIFIKDAAEPALNFLRAYANKRL